ncbi:unnamed protein product, partial [Medioppia subpectinata]
PLRMGFGTTADQSCMAYEGMSGGGLSLNEWQSRSLRNSPAIQLLHQYNCGWGLSVNHGHSVPIMQLVSDLGAISPEANIFTLFLTIEGVLMYITCAVRYAMVKSHIDNDNNNNNSDKNVKYNPGRLKLYNKLSLISGLAMGCGFIGCASFRTSEGLAVVALHLISSTLFYGPIIGDMALQSAIAFAQSRPGVGRFRRNLAIVQFILSNAYIIFLFWSWWSLTDKQVIYDFNTRVNWSSDQPVKSVKPKAMEMV